MYICSKCGEVFDEPLREEERPCSDFPETEIWCYCPHCHSDDYEEAVRCLICEQWHKESECDENVCEDCIGNIMKNFYNIIINNFSDEERSVIGNNIDANRI